MNINLMMNDLLVSCDLLQKKNEGTRSIIPKDISTKYYKNLIKDMNNLISLRASIMEQYRKYGE